MKLCILILLLARIKTMNTNKNHQTLLLTLLIISVVITAFHYTDNFINFLQYPDPEWLTPQSVYQSWLILTAIGIVGYVLYINNILLFEYLFAYWYVKSGTLLFSDN